MSYDRLQEEANSGACIFRNSYICPHCQNQWRDDWSAMCDDDCPKCGLRHISPTESEDVTAEYRQAA